MENASRNFSKIFIFWVVTQAVLLENSSIQILTETFSAKIYNDNMGGVDNYDIYLHKYTLRYTIEA